MKRIHDASVRDEIKRRLMTLTPSAERRWGKMTPDQMLWHCAEPIEVALGKKPYGEMMPKPPLPSGMVRWLLLHMPWPKGKLPTAPSFVARSAYDFEAQRARLLGLIDELAARDEAGMAQRHPIFQENTIHYQSQLQAKHLCHHLDQFGV
jgi:hypothetical protein